MRVLLVEDNPGDVELVAARLRDSQGERVDLVVAESLEEALAEVTRGPLDAALLDLNLPDSDGLETLAALRRAKEDLPIVVLTGTDDLDLAVTALREGADDYIAKSELAGHGSLRRVLRYGVERRRTLAELRVAVRSREELLSVVSHDLRNHIQTIELGSQVLRTCTTPEALERRVAAIERASHTVRRLLDDLVDLAAFEMGTLAVDRAPIDLVPLVQEAHTSFLPAAEQRGAVLVLAVPDGVVTASADAVRVTQILGNLLGNALKFAPPGSTVSLSLRAERDAATLVVEDEGPGVPAADVPRIFDRFFRASNTAGKGAGLGLAITRALVVAHQGTIWVDSAVGRGARFCVSLPRQTP